MEPDARADLAAERVVLGGCLAAPATLAVVRARLRPEDFAHPAHAETFAALCALADAGRPLDATGLAGELRRRKRLETVRAVLDPAELEFYGLADPARVEGHAATVAGLAEVRATRAAAVAIARAAADPATDPAALRALVGAQLGAIQARGAGAHTRTFRELGGELYDRLTAAAAAGTTANDGVPSGVAGLDEYTGGLHPGELTVLGARPRVGKTSLAMQFALAVAGAGRPVLAFSLEMSASALFLRAACGAAGVEATSLRNLVVDQAMLTQFTGAINDLAALPVYVDDRAGASLADIRAAALALRAKAGGLGLLVVDYLQLAATEARKGGTREQEVSGLSRGLKTLAREAGVPVLALSQLSRAVEQRPDKRPVLSDLRESGALEQDADVVLFLYRDHLYNPKADPTSAELTLAKHRAGACGTIPLRWEGAFTRFDDPGVSAPSRQHAPHRPHPSDPDAWSGDIDDTFTSRGGDAQ